MILSRYSHISTESFKGSATKVAFCKIGLRFGLGRSLTTAEALGAFEAAAKGMVRYGPKWLPISFRGICEGYGTCIRNTGTECW